MARKIDRHDLKKNEFATDIAKVYEYVVENPTKALIWAIIVAVAAVAVIGYLNHRKNTKADVQFKLSLVYTMMEAGQYREAMDTVNVILDNYDGSEQAKIAKYLTAHMYYAFGLPDSAITAYEEYLLFEEPDSDLAAASLIGIAACYEDRSRYPNAIEYYQRAYDEYPNFFRSDESLLGVGRCYDIQGDFDNAKKYYNEFLEKYPNSALKNRVDVLLSRVESRTFASAPPDTKKPKPVEPIPDESIPAESNDEG